LLTCQIGGKLTISKTNIWYKKEGKGETPLDNYLITMVKYYYKLDIEPERAFLKPRITQIDANYIDLYH
jgi:hypothetical protein